MSLTDTAIRNAKPLDKSWKLSDAQGLYLLIKPNGSKLWHLKYRFGGKEKKLAFGAYPAVSLANARKMREDARSVLSAGNDPGVKKQQEKFARKSGNTLRISPVNGWRAISAGMKPMPPKSCARWSCMFFHCSANSRSLI